MRKWRLDHSITHLKHNCLFQAYIIYKGQTYIQENVCVQELGWDTALPTRSRLNRRAQRREQRPGMNDFRWKTRQEIGFTDLIWGKHSAKNKQEENQGEHRKETQAGVREAFQEKKPCNQFKTGWFYTLPSKAMKSHCNQKLTANINLWWHVTCFIWNIPCFLWFWMCRNYVSKICFVAAIFHFSMKILFLLWVVPGINMLHSVLFYIYFSQRSVLQISEECWQSTLFSLHRSFVDNVIPKRAGFLVAVLPLYYYHSVVTITVKLVLLSAC